MLNLRSRKICLPKTPRCKDRERWYIFWWRRSAHVIKRNSLIVPDFDQDFKQLNEILVDLSMNDSVSNSIDIAKRSQHSSPQHHRDIR